MLHIITACGYSTCLSKQRQFYVLVIMLYRLVSPHLCSYSLIGGTSSWGILPRCCRWELGRRWLNFQHSAGGLYNDSTFAGRRWPPSVGYGKRASCCVLFFFSHTCSPFRRLSSISMNILCRVGVFGHKVNWTFTTFTFSSFNTCKKKNEGTNNLFSSTVCTTSDTNYFVSPVVMSPMPRLAIMDTLVEPVPW